jgi:hypothetical protein
MTIQRGITTAAPLSGLWKGSGRSNRPLTMLNTAVLAPMPSASVSTTTAVKPGLLTKRFLPSLGLRIDDIQSRHASCRWSEGPVGPAEGKQLMVTFLAGSARSSRLVAYHESRRVQRHATVPLAQYLDNLSKTEQRLRM